MVTLTRINADSKAVAFGVQRDGNKLAVVTVRQVDVEEHEKGYEITMRRFTSPSELSPVEFGAIVAIDPIHRDQGRPVRHGLSQARCG